MNYDLNQMVLEGETRRDAATALASVEANLRACSFHLSVAASFMLEMAKELERQKHALSGAAMSTMDWADALRETASEYGASLD